MKGASERVDEAVSDGFDQMVLFAEYRFNKSHSTAYGAVTYQTAYLKALPRRLHGRPAHGECRRSRQGAAVHRQLQCHGHRGDATGRQCLRTDFTPNGDRILFGLSAVRNLGDGAIRQLIRSRDSDGPFRSLPDLCDRIPSSVLNRRGLESLIHCGALDSMDPAANRAQLMADLDLLLDWASSRAKDRDSGQGNLFDLMAAPNDEDGASDLSLAPKAAPVADYGPAEKLKLERSCLVSICPTIRSSNSHPVLDYSHPSAWGRLKSNRTRPRSVPSR